MIKKGLAVAVILLFIGMCVVPSTAIQELKETTFPINFDGNTLYVGGSGPNNYTKIQDAIDNANNGDTVYVFEYSSPYIENVTIPLSINLIGEDRDTTIIRGEGVPHKPITVQSDYVTISGFTIESSYECIYINNKMDVCISDCIFKSDDDSILIEGGGNHHISGNIFDKHVHSAISTWDAYGLNISGNIIDNTNPYHDLPYADFNIVRTNNSVFSKNHFFGNDEDYITGIFFVASSDNIIDFNTIESYNYYGIYLLENSDDNSIQNNIISNCSVGIFFSAANFNTISYNSIADNNDGLYLVASHLNEIKYNNFINNNADFSRSFLNTWDGNYWDGAQESPYIIRGALFFLFIPWWNFDWNPAQEPYDIGV